MNTTNMNQRFDTSKVILRRGRFLLLILVVELILAASAPTYQVPTDAFDRLSKIAQAYHIEILTTGMTFPVKNAYGLIEGKPAERKEMENYIGLFAPEFTLYPKSLVKLSRLKRIVICNELSFGGQRRNAIPDFEHDTLYLDASRGSDSRAYMRKVIHHEFFHIVDWLDDGKLYQDERWSSLNPPGFKYGSGGINAQNLFFSGILTDKFPGFLNYYSTTGVEEDKAKLFANLIVDPAYVELRIKTDAVLGAKVRMMMELLRSFCPDLNDEFWKKARHAERTAEWGTKGTDERIRSVQLATEGTDTLLVAVDATLFHNDWSGKISVSHSAGARFLEQTANSPELSGAHLVLSGKPGRRHVQDA